MSRSWAGGSTRRWRRLRLQVLDRDRYQCQLALPGVCTSKATHVHHLVGKRYGDHPSLLVAACQACNLKTGNPERTTDPKPKPMTRW